MANERLPYCWNFAGLTQTHQCQSQQNEPNLAVSKLTLTEMIFQVPQKQAASRKIEELETWKIGEPIIYTIPETHVYCFGGCCRG